MERYQEYRRRDERSRHDHFKQLQRELENKILMDSQELFPQEPRPLEPATNKVLLLL